MISRVATVAAGLCILARLECAAGAFASHSLPGAGSDPLPADLAPAPGPADFLCTINGDHLANSCDEFVQGIADLGDVYGLEQPGDRAANATLAAALAKAPVPISNECCRFYQLYYASSCRCDTEAQEIVLTAAAVNESQLQASAVAAAILCPSAILDAEYGHACSDAEQHLNE